MELTTIAYRALTGARLWVSKYSSRPANHSAGVSSVKVGPDGMSVFVAGTASGHCVTVAHRAATGARLWASLRNPGGDSFARAMALSPDGTKLFVTGYSYLPATYYDYATMAYDAVTGAWLWTRRYSGPGSLSDIPRSIAVSPGGGSVFVTGTSFGSSPAGTDYVTIAYRS